VKTLYITVETLLLLVSAHTCCFRINRFLVHVQCKEMHELKRRYNLRISV